MQAEKLTEAEGYFHTGLGNVPVSFPIPPSFREACLWDGGVFHIRNFLQLAEFSYRIYKLHCEHYFDLQYLCRSHNVLYF